MINNWHHTIEIIKNIPQNLCLVLHKPQETPNQSLSRTNEPRPKWFDSILCDDSVLRHQQKYALANYQQLPKKHSAFFNYSFIITTDLEAKFSKPWKFDPITALVRSWRIVET